METAPLEAIVKAYGTPCFVFDEAALARRMHAVREIVGERMRLCYSVKANPFLIPAMCGLVETLEVCSPGELEICMALGVRPFSSPGSTRPGGMWSVPWTWGSPGSRANPRCMCA